MAHQRDRDEAAIFKVVHDAQKRAEPQAPVATRRDAVTEILAGGILPGRPTSQAINRNRSLPVRSTTIVSETNDSRAPPRRLPDAQRNPSTSTRPSSRALATHSSVRALEMPQSIALSHPPDSNAMNNDVDVNRKSTNFSPTNIAAPQHSSSGMRREFASLAPRKLLPFSRGPSTMRKSVKSKEICLTKNSSIRKSSHLIKSPKTTSRPPMKHGEDKAYETKFTKTPENVDSKETSSARLSRKNVSTKVVKKEKYRKPPPKSEVWNDNDVVIIESSEDDPPRNDEKKKDSVAASSNAINEPPPNESDDDTIDLTKPLPTNDTTRPSSQREEEAVSHPYRTVSPNNDIESTPPSPIIARNETSSVPPQSAPSHIDMNTSSAALPNEPISSSSPRSPSPPRKAGSGASVNDSPALPTSERTEMNYCSPKSPPPSPPPRRDTEEKKMISSSDDSSSSSSGSSSSSSSSSQYMPRDLGTKNPTPATTQREEENKTKEQRHHLKKMTELEKQYLQVTMDSGYVRNVLVLEYLADVNKHFVRFLDKTGGSTRVDLQTNKWRLLTEEETEDVQYEHGAEAYVDRTEPERIRVQPKRRRVPPRKQENNSAVVTKRHRTPILNVDGTLDNKAPPGGELIGAMIEIRWPGNGEMFVALVVGCQHEAFGKRKHKIYYMLDESTEIIDLTTRHYIPNGPGCNKWDTTGLVGKRVVVMWDGVYENEPEDAIARPLPYEAFVVKYIKDFRYRLLYTPEDNLEDRDMDINTDSWELCEPGVWYFEDLPVISWSNVPEAVEPVRERDEV